MFERILRWTLVAVAVSGLAAGLLAHLAGRADLAALAFTAATIPVILGLMVAIVRDLLAGRVGVDAIALVSMSAAIALGQPLAGAVVALMYSGGNVLEDIAVARAEHDLRSLVDRAPREAHRVVEGRVEEVPISAIAIGDRLLVHAGEVVPVDGVVNSHAATIDESALTGEPIPVIKTRGVAIFSGSLNAGETFEMSVSALAGESTYAGIVRLAQQAGADSAPIVRLADRYAAWFLPLSLLLAGAAWAASGSAVRAVAVLVVATPCPLLLAAPVAIVSGLSRASRAGVIIRSGGALENLGKATTLVLDKTGTLTMGHPSVVDVIAAPHLDAATLLRLAASVDQFSPHVLAEAIVTEALSRGAQLSLPSDMCEEPGRGVTATVESQRVSVGKLPADRVPNGWGRAVVNRASLDNAAIAWVCIQGDPVGAVLLRDPLRRQAPRTVRRLRAAGLDRLVMLTGDRREPAGEVATVLGLDEVYAEQTPADKVAAVRLEGRRAVTVMVGDGINDAPALAAATVGVAMGARGATASSEAADIVLTTDRVERLADAMDIARWSRRIAVQSAAVGMTLSLIAMVIAALGWLPPAAGALLQEGIDIAVILNALRALGRNPDTAVDLPTETDELLRRFAAEHDELRDTLGLLRESADRLAAAPDAAALTSLKSVQRLLTDRIVPHELAEETRLYPALARPLGSREATATMSRTHAEIQRLADRIAKHAELAEAAGAIQSDQLGDLLACLYGLYALLRLHFVQEEESYFTLAKDAPSIGERGDQHRQTVSSLAKRTSRTSS